MNWVHEVNLSERARFCTPLRVSYNGHGAPKVVQGVLSFVWEQRRQFEHVSQAHYWYGILVSCEDYHIAATRSNQTTIGQYSMGRN